MVKEEVKTQFIVETRRNKAPIENRPWHYFEGFPNRAAAEHLMDYLRTDGERKTDFQYRVVKQTTIVTREVLDV